MTLAAQNVRKSSRSSLAGTLLCAALMQHTATQGGGMFANGATQGGGMFSRASGSAS